MNLSITRAHGDLLASVKSHCEKYHYLHYWPDARSLPFAYALSLDNEERAPDSCLWGLMVLKKLQHHRQGGLFGYPDLPTAWQVLDICRIWIHPDLQQPGLNMFSRMVSRLWERVGDGHDRLCRVQSDWLAHHPPRFPELPYHIELLASYADLRHHTGTGYRAAGFKEWGTNDAKTLFVRSLPKPRVQWTPEKPVQPPLFPELGLPLRHV